MAIFYFIQMTILILDMEKKKCIVLIPEVWRRFRELKKDNERNLI